MIKRLVFTFLCIGVVGYEILNNGNLTVPIISESRSKATQIVERVAESTGSSLRILEDKSLKRLEGIAYGVYDGDTCWISLKNGDKEKLRFVHIDAPEKNQPMGLESQKFLANLIDGREIIAVVEGTDKYGRKLVRVYYDGHDVNAEMVKNGYAWHYKNYDVKGTAVYNEFSDYEKSARESGLGIWGNDNPEPPWEFRKKSRP